MKNKYKNVEWLSDRDSVVEESNLNDPEFRVAFSKYKISILYRKIISSRASARFLEKKGLLVDAKLLSERADGWLQEFRQELRQWNQQELKGSKSSG